MNAETDFHPDPAAKLIRMASEIAEFYAPYPQQEGAAAVARHINRYWTPKMREQFLAAAETKEIVLPPLLNEARKQIKTRKSN